MSGINAILGIDFILGITGFLALLVWWIVKMIRNRAE